MNKFVQIEYSEQESFYISKQEIIDELGYEQRNGFDEIEFTDGSVIDKFNGEHSQDECWQILSEYEPTDEELYKIIEIKH
jgi:hypothetical protein